MLPRSRTLGRLCAAVWCSSAVLLARAWQLQPARHLVARPTMMGLQGRHTLIGDYRVDLSSPSSLPDLLRAHPEWDLVTGSADAPSTASLHRLWTVVRRPCSTIAGVVASSGLGGTLYADESLAAEQDICQLLSVAVQPPPSAPAAAGLGEGGELASWVDDRGESLLPFGVPRLVVHRLNLLHRGAGILVRDAKGRVFVHQRSSTKRIFPALYDMFVGGVSLYGEPSLTTARREVKEELGVGGEQAAFAFLFSCIIETDMNRCFVDVFEYKVTPEEVVRIDQDEVQWGDYMSLEAIQENLEQGQWEWVPDGLQVWDGLVRYWQTRRLRRY